MGRGLTDNYLRVLATAPVGADLHNRITAARWWACKATTWPAQWCSELIKEQYP